MGLGAPRIMSEEEVEAPSLEDRLAEAIARAEKAEAEITYKEADIVNIRRRAATEKSDMIQFAGFNLAGRILPVLDSLDRALASAEEGPLTEGVRMTRGVLVDALTAEGITAIEAKGATFDPNMMEAITTVPASEAHPADVVVDVLESGWMYKTRVLRAARVVVATE